MKPDFFKDEDIKDLPYEARLFFAGMWCFADKEGRIEDRPQRLKVEIMPYDNIDAEKILCLLSEPKKGSNKPFIFRYSVNNENYIQILSWHKHQKPHHTEKESLIPPAPPLMEKGMGTEKGMGMGMGMGSIHHASDELKNGEITVNPTLKEKKDDYPFPKIPKNPLGNSGESWGSPLQVEVEGKGNTLIESSQIPNNESTAKPEIIGDNNVVEVFRYFCEKTGRNLKLTKVRQDIIEKRFKDGRTLAEMKIAVDNFILDDWADRQKYTDIVYCIGVRNRVDNLDKWLEFKPKRSEPRGFQGLRDYAKDRQKGACGN